MLIAVLLIVVLVGAVAAAGVAAASGSRDAERSFFGGAGPPLVLLGGVVGVVVLVTAALFLVGVRGGGGGGDAESPTPSTSTPGTSTPTTSAPSVADPAPAPALPAGGAPALAAEAGPHLTITSGASPATVDRLPDRAVLVVTADGFKPGTGEVAQCRLHAEGRPDCVNRFPVQFDDGGTARFQYLVSEEVGSDGHCGAGQASCLVVVFGAHGEDRGSAFTVFGAAAPPPGRVRIEPQAGLSDGDIVTVSASGFPPATRLVATQCPPGPVIDPGRCRGAVAGRTGPEGAAVLRLTVRTGEVGGVACGSRRPCSVRVVAEAPVAPVSLPVAFSGGPSVRYGGGRLAGGLTLTVLLLVLAWRLFRATDWQEPAAASTPEMDRAVLDG